MNDKAWMSFTQKTGEIVSLLEDMFQGIGNFTRRLQQKGLIRSTGKMLISN